MNEHDFPDVAKHIKAYRKANGYTQQQMADMLEIKRTNYAKIETNVSHGSLDILIKIAKLLGISMDTLLGLNDESKICFDMPSRLRSDFFSFCGEIGISPDAAFNMFAAATVREQKIPFPLSLYKDK